MLSREQPYWKVPLAEVCRPEREGRWVEAGGPGLCSIPGMGDRLRGTISTAPSFGDSLGEGGGVAREEEAATSFSQCVSGRITVPLGPLNGAEEEAEVRVPSPVSQGAGSGVCRQ